MTIRFAEKTDLPGVNAVRRQVHMVHAEGRPDIFRKKFGKKLAGRIKILFRDKSARIAVAEKDGNIVGFAVMKIIDKPKSPYSKARRFLRVEEFGVDGACRRQGFSTYRRYMEYKM